MKNTIFIFIVIFAISCATKNNVDVSVYPIVTTVNEISQFYGFNTDNSGKYENTSITKYLNGSVELIYEYDLVDSDEYIPLYYSLTITKERNINEAKSVYNISKKTLDFVTNSFNQGTIEIDSIDLPGDEAFYAVRTYDDIPNGLTYMVRKDKFIYTLLISGIYTSDHSLLTEFLIPKTKNLEEFEIIDPK